MKEAMDLFDLVMQRPDGSWLKTSIAVGADRSLWVEPSYLGLSAKGLDRLRRDVGAAVRRDPVDGRIYVEARAVIADCKSVEKQKELAVLVDGFLDALHPTEFR